MKFCPQCGSPTSSTEQKWCGSCGADLQPAPVEASSSGSDAGPESTVVLPPPGEPSIVPPPAGAASVAAPAADHATLALTQGTGRGAPSWLRPRVIIGAVLGVFLLVGVGVVALKFVFPPGGASSPEEAVTGMVESLAKQDPVGALRLVNPGEVEGFDDVFTSAEKRLEDAGISNGGQLTDAITITVSGLEVETDEIGDNAARVYVDKGELEVSYDPSKLSDKIKTVVGGNGKARSWTVDLSSIFEEQPLYGIEGGEIYGDAPFVTAVKTDGRWYVSPLATAGEYLSELANASGGNFSALDDDASDDGKGAEDPEDALETLLGSVESQDFEAIANSLPGQQGTITAAYADLISQLLTENVSYSVDLGTVRTKADVDGDLAKITVSDVDMDVAGSAYGDYGETSVELSDTCIETSADGDACLGRRFSQLTGVDSLYVMARKGDAGWQIDPLATIVSYATQVLDTLPDDVAFRALDVPVLIEPRVALTPGEETTVKLGESGAAVVTVEATKGQVLGLTASDSVYGLTYSGGSGGLFSDQYSSLGDAGFEVVEKDGTQQIVLLDESWKSSEVTVTVSVITPTDAGPEDPIAKGEAHRITIDGDYVMPEGLVLCNAEDDFYCSTYFGTGSTGEHILIALEDGLTLEKLKTGFEDGSTVYDGTVSGGESTTFGFNAVADQPIVITATPNQDFDLKVSVVGDGDSADTGLSGDTERYSFYPASSGYYSIEIYAFGDDGGSFTVTLDDN